MSFNVTPITKLCELYDKNMTWKTRDFPFVCNIEKN